MATHFEKTVSATQFKATCLELIEDGAKHRLDRIHITKRGKPFITLEVKADSGGATLDTVAPTIDSIFAFMKGSVIVPPNFDWEQSPYTDAELAEMDARLDEKFKHLL